MFLVYAVDVDHPHHKASRALLDAARQRSAILSTDCCEHESQQNPQNLYLQYR
jgi:hypothetical protein